MVKLKTNEVDEYADEIPNAETIAHGDSVPSYSSVEELMKSSEGDDED